MCIYDRYNFLMVVYVGHDREIIARKPGSDFLPTKRSDCCILGGGGYILGGEGWWGYILGGDWWGLFWVVVGTFWGVLGDGGYFLSDGGWCW